MRTIKYIFGLLFLTCFFSSNAMALQRAYEAEEYCSLHQKPSNKLSLIEKYISLIPGSSGECVHVECPQCHDVWTEYYLHDNDDDEWTEIYWNCHCKEQLINKSYRKYWDHWMPNWIKCNKRPIYDGYLSNNHIKYFSFLQEYLQYIDQNKSCTCFWPEVSKKAAVINDTAFSLFKNLFTNTDLRELVDDLDQQKDFFITVPEYGFNLYGVTLSCICQSFFYSDYDWICRDIDFYSTQHFKEKSAAEIRSKLDEIREKLAPLFLNVYLECLKKHPHEIIEQQLCLVRSFLNLPLFETNYKYFSLLENALPKAHDFSHYFETYNLDQNGNAEVCSHNLSEKRRKSSNKPFCYRHKNELFSSNFDPDYLSLVDIPSPPKNRVQSDVYLSHGIFYNDLNLYVEAIQFLTQAIQLNSSNRNAYIERAMAYFETNKVFLALQDYETAKKLTIVPPFKPGIYKSVKMADIYIPDNKTEFSKGLVSGTVDGAKISASEFIPSIFSCYRGILNGLWAFVCSPIEVSQEVISAAYIIGEFISTQSAEECFQCVVPELKELSLSWNNLNDYSRGQKIGYIIGKYGIDIFAPAGALKGVNKVRALKRANTMFTLENCAASQVRQSKILEESAKRLALRERIVADSIKKGKILIKSSNVQYHVMQPKHAWDIVLKLSGNVEEDFKKVAILLEEHSILSEKYLLESENFSHGKIIRADYKKIINGHEVRAAFETYMETNQTFLKDAWVITK